jgi:hypothetical protein
MLLLKGVHKTTMYVHQYALDVYRNQQFNVQNRFLVIIRINIIEDELDIKFEIVIIQKFTLDISNFSIRENPKL